MSFSSEESSEGEHIAAQNARLYKDLGSYEKQYLVLQRVKGKQSKVEQARKLDHARNKRKQSGRLNKKHTRRMQLARDAKRGVRRGATPFAITAVSIMYRERRLREYQEEMGAAIVVRKAQTERDRLAEEKRVAPIRERKKSGLMEHREVDKQIEREIVWRNYEAERVKRELKADKEAKYRKGLMMQLGSNEAKAQYIAEMLGYTRKKIEVNREKEIEKEKKREQESEIRKEIKKSKQPIIKTSTASLRQQIEEQSEEQKWEELEGKVRGSERKGKEKKGKEKEKEEEKEREKEKEKGEKGEKESKSSRKWEKVGKSEKEIAITILGHLNVKELEEVAEKLNEYVDVEKVVDEETILRSFTRTVNSAKKILLGGTQETKLDTPFAVKAFDSKGYAEGFLKAQRMDESERAYPIVQMQENFWTNTLKYGALSIVATREMFEYVFDVFTNQFFRGVNLVGGIMAGGLVTACLQPLPPIQIRRFSKYRELNTTVKKINLPSYIIQRILFYSDLESELEAFRKALHTKFNSSYQFSDIDIFVVADTLDEAEKKVRRLYKNIKKRYKQLKESYVLVRTSNTITFCSPKYKNIQIVVSVLRNLDDFLLFCDLDCTSCVYDGKEVYMSPRSVRAFNKRYNVVNPVQLNHYATRCRVVKYGLRGYSTLLFHLKRAPGFDFQTTRKYVRELSEPINPRVMRHRFIFDEYTAERPVFFEGDTLPDMELVLKNAGVLFGQKWKEVWKRVKKVEAKEGEGEGDRPQARQWSRYGRYRESAPTDIVVEEEESDKEGERGSEEENPVLRWKWIDSQKSSDVAHLLPRCYMCRKRSVPCYLPGQYRLTLCEDCVKKNKEMMDQWDDVKDIDDCVALVTGARIKIGYYIALRLLRSGATVIAVTRFPNDAALRYSNEPDFFKWKERLHIYGVDLRHLPSVNEFIVHVLKFYKRIDMLINNAAQTKRRPRAYYYEVTQRERKLLTQGSNQLVKNFSSNPHMIEFDISPSSPSSPSKAMVVSKGDLAENAMVPLGDLDLDPSLPTSAALAQVKLHPMDVAERDDSLFPPGLVDEHNEPLDLRPSTSWNQKIDEISTVELVEVQIVNSTVPFMFISSFTPLLKEAAKVSNRKRAFVVNVTAVEGMFSYNKRNGGHPHTNMAKAALNMMTKSIGETFAQSNIFATAVDTGWCTEMRYVPMSKRDETGVPLNPVPLTDKDGAARVLYPIYVGLTSETPPPYGVLYHDYEVVPWD